THFWWLIGRLYNLPMGPSRSNHRWSPLARSARIEIAITTVLFIFPIVTLADKITDLLRGDTDLSTAVCSLAKDSIADFTRIYRGGIRCRSGGVFEHLTV